MSAGLFLLFLFSFFFFWLGFLLYYAMLVLKRGQIFFMVYIGIQIFFLLPLVFLRVSIGPCLPGFVFLLLGSLFFVLAVCAASWMEV